LPPQHESKIAVVTGGSRNIGKAIVLALAHEGHDVAINYLSQHEPAQKLAAEVRAIGRNAMTAQADVTVESQVQAMVESVVETFGSPSLLVNNVGPFLMKSVSDSTAQEWSDMIAGNLTSAFLCAQAFRDHIRRNHGSIIFIGGPNAEQLRAAPNTGAYTIAKNGVVALAKTLAREEAKYGVRVNVVNPGIIGTSSEMDARLAKQVPLGRVGTPENIAQAVVFLASEKASYITGAVLNVSGGLWV